MDHAANRDTPCYDERVPSSQERPMARVRFDPTVTIHPSSPFLLSPLECHHLWYRTRDFSVFSRQNRELVEEYRRLAEAGGQDLSLLHARGLEVKLAKGNTNEVLFRHELVTRMVLQEQAKQRFEGVTNPSLLRAVSLSVSRRANYLAYKLGKQDALDAIADQALLRGTGARGLRAILEEVLLNVMYDVPSRKDVAKVVITGEVVKGSVNPTLVRRDAKSRTPREKSA